MKVYLGIREPGAELAATTIFGIPASERNFARIRCE
jgi:hypothetical protein